MLFAVLIGGACSLFLPEPTQPKRPSSQHHAEWRDAYRSAMAKMANSEYELAGLDLEQALELDPDSFQTWTALRACVVKLNLAVPRNGSAVLQEALLVIASLARLTAHTVSIIITTAGT